MLTKGDLSVIYYLQTKTRTESLGKRELQKLTALAGFPEDEFSEYLSFSHNPEELLPFDENSLQCYLQLKYSKMFPFSLVCFTGNPEQLRKTILWWFTNNTSFDPLNINLPDESKLNKEQFSLITNIRTLREKRKTLLQICNAGPGTGKTTAANALSYALREEGVLLISYTNESIRENYKRFFDYPTGKKCTGLKKYNGPQINLITIDSLSARIVGDSSGKNFDEAIQLASIRIDPYQFLHPTRGKMYNHIVVDECQDIDDLRGNFILSFCEQIGIKSLTLCGDPRQKIRENCGKWYTELWEDTYDYSKNGHNGSNFGPTFRIGFKETYRFQNRQILNMVNHLSQKRPSLHVELSMAKEVIMDQKPVEIITLDRLTCDKSIRDILGPDETACIIGPSIDADNNTSNVGRTIAGIFRAQGYSLCFRSEGAFQTDAIPFLTIHSVKGREFDKVFIFGMDNYPARFSMIPMEEALSLIFVAHSRAKKMIYYIDGNNSSMGFTIPLHMEHSFIDMRRYEGSVNKPYQDFDNLNSEQMRHFNVCQLVEEHSFTRFLEENRFSVSFNDQYYEPDDWNALKRPPQIPYSAWGWVLGFDFQTQLTSYEEVYNFYFGDILEDNYVVLGEETIVKNLLAGTIVNNHLVKDNRRVFNKPIEKKDIELCEEYSVKKSISVALYLHSKYYEDIDLELKDLKSVLDEYPKLCGSPTLVAALKGGRVESPFTDNDLKVLHGRADYIDTNQNVYEFKSTSSSTKDYKSLLQSWLYYVMLGERQSFAHVLDLSTGKLFELKSNENIDRWRYILRCYFVLRHHVDLVTARRNYYTTYGTESQREAITKSMSISDNAYTVDTEFYDREVFEIALVNVNDPYRTIVDLLIPSSIEGMRFALDWLPDTTIDMYKSSIRDVKVKFNLGVAKSKEDLILGYYIANTDVEWCNRKDVIKLNLGTSARRVAENVGSFTAGNFGPKLGELYTTLAPFPLEYQSHLQAHTALSDSLMLYELLKLGLLQI